MTYKANLQLVRCCSLCLQLVDRASGFQNEVPDIWLTDGNPWEVKRNDVRFKVAFGGKVDKKDGKSVWTPAEEVSGSLLSAVTRSVIMVHKHKPIWLSQ